LGVVQRLKENPLTFFGQGVAGLTKRDIQLVMDGGYQTVEAVAYTPRRTLETIKGISEQKAAKILAEGMCAPTPTAFRFSHFDRSGLTIMHSFKVGAHGLHDRNGDAPEKK
jgi:hypothetical protein